MKKIYLGVREFALPVPRVGSIESHSGYGAMPLNGQELHGLIQGRYLQKFTNYRHEFKLVCVFERGGYEFHISGRVDGLFEGDVPRIEEIKTTFNEYELKNRLLEETQHPYRMQLQSYIYFYQQQYGKIPKANFLIVSSRNQKSVDLYVDYSEAVYLEWLDKRLDELVVETKIREANLKRRKKLATKLEFPFTSPRSGQLELVQTVEKSLLGSRQILLQAPTGLGKTAGILYPNVKESLARGCQTVYVTPKNSQHEVAEDAVRRFQSQGQNVKALTINAKSKMCFKEEVICNPKYCEYAKDYYEKVAAHGLVQKVAKKKNMTPQTFLKVGEEYQVCPFELSLDSLENADVVIGDYNYVFAPRNILGRLSPDPKAKKTRPNLVVDEAHNLPSRAQDYFSPELSTFVVQGFSRSMAKRVKSFATEGQKLAEEAIETIKALQPPRGKNLIQINPMTFIEIDGKLRDFLGRYLESSAEIEALDPIIGLANYWSNFTQNSEAVGDAFFVTYQHETDGATIKITCCDAGDLIKPTYESFHHATLFSATLKPFDYYAQLSGLGTDFETHEFQSPFPKENRKVLVIPQVSTRYQDREGNYTKIARAIERLVTLKRGNYFIFFPSFDFLERVLELVSLNDFALRRQNRDMKLSDIREVLRDLREGLQPTLVFAVQGGVFSEGVDYPGDMIIGAFIVGPALPSFTPERKIMQEYYDRHYVKGFDYAYTYPAMTRVVQAAGRVIRSETDRGLIVLMDARFRQESYSKSMPSDWFTSSVDELVSQQIVSDVKEFWNRDEKQ